MVYLVVLGVVFIGPIVMGAALLVILDHALVDVEGPGDRAADDAALDASNAAPPYRRLMMSKAGGNFD